MKDITEILAEISHNRQAMDAFAEVENWDDFHNALGWLEALQWVVNEESNEEEK